MGVTPERIYVDLGLTGTNRHRPGLREALAACRPGDTLVVTKLDRLARSLPDARAIADELTARQVKLSLGGSVYDPTDAVGRLLFNVPAMVAEFEADLIRLRTTEGMKVAKAKGHLHGTHPKLTRRQEAHLVPLLHSGEYSTAEVADLFAVAAPPSTARSSDSEPRHTHTSMRPRRSQARVHGRCPAWHTPAGHQLRQPGITFRFTGDGSCYGTYRAVRSRQARVQSTSETGMCGSEDSERGLAQD